MMEQERLIWAAGLGLAYAGVCVAAWRQWRRSRRAASVAAPWLVAYASQSGQAEAVAQQTAAALQAAGLAVQCLPLAQLDVAALQQASRLLLVASTAGEGEPPDMARRFAANLAMPAALPGLQYAVLALGDRRYAQFCAFGRALDAWLADSGARPLYPCLEVDALDDVALATWRQQLAELAGLPDGDIAIDMAPAAQPFARWQLLERRCLNEGSCGAATYHLALQPADGGALPQWQSGDLVEVQVPADPARPREYSIASIPADGSLHLLVRVRADEQGRVGLASQHLTRDLALGEVLNVRIRPHRRFRLADNATRPLILIGNGTGLAGLRSHLRARQQLAAAQPGWLLFGERQAAHDFYYQHELQALQQQGVLQHVDTAFSRDQAQRRYVQHVLAEQAERLQQWVADGAAIYVCGSLAGMASGVDTVLREVLGEAALDALAAEGRYCRDVY